MEPRCPFTHVLDPHAADLHAEAAHLRTHAPAVRVELPGKVLAWSVTRAEVARRLLADHRLAKNARRHWPEWIDGRVGPDWPLASWVAVESMFTSDGEDHHRLRTLTAPAGWRPCGPGSARSSPRCSTGCATPRPARRSTCTPGSPTRCRPP
ncbi:hypothetical protein ACW14Y_35340 [Kitasatospora sp. cg17-2]